MEVLFFALVIGLVFILANVGNQIEHNPYPSLRCPPHIWVSKKQPDSGDEYLQCHKCKRVPNTGNGEEI